MINAKEKNGAEEGTGGIYLWVVILSRVFKESYQEGDIAKNLKKKVSEQPLYLLERGIF